MADRLRDLARRTRGGPDEPMAREEVALVRDGEEASAVFELENRTWNVLTPRFFSTSFEGGPRRLAVRIDVDCAPERGRDAEIWPGQSARYRVVAHARDDALRPDWDYRGTLLAADGARVFAEIALRIERAGRRR